MIFPIVPDPMDNHTPILPDELPPKPVVEPVTRPPLDLATLWAQVLLTTRYLKRAVWEKKSDKG
jgi:hypothetical protein